MNEDYLWDKSGEPDPEIQRLEQILGTLRYEEKPLELPEQITPSRSHNHVFLLAIAATLLLALVGAGLWLKARNNQGPQEEYAKAPTSNSTPEPKKEERLADKSTVLDTPSVEKKETEPRRHVARAKIQTKQAWTSEQREEALAAKQQLMLALRLASEKLNEVQRRTVSPVTPAKNQHKVG